MTEEIDLRLAHLKARIEDSEELFAFGDAGVLLVLGGHLCAVGIARVELDEENIELLLGQLLVERGDLGAGGELNRGALDTEPALGELVPKPGRLRARRGERRRRTRGPWPYGPYRRTER